MLNVDADSFLAIVAAAALASVLVALGGKRAVVPVVVLELVLGMVIGPDLLDLAQPDSFVDFFASLGLGMLFFFAGYEIDFGRIRGAPLKLAAVGWVISLALAYGIGGILASAGLVLSLLFTGSALATTAIGTLVPILGDAGELKTRFGTYIMAAGAIGEFGPILLITLFFSAGNPLSSALVLAAFVVVAVVAALFAIRGVNLGWDAFERSLETSAQLPIRVAVVLIFALAALAADLGLDLLLGGFVAGIITRLAIGGREVPILESKLSAVGYGFLIPFFFVVSGIEFKLDALTSHPHQLIKVPIFLLAFLIVRGAPALLLYRGVLDLRDRLALAFLSATELPLVVAITTIAIDKGEMRATTAASLVGAAVLSTAIFPLLGLRLRGSRALSEGV
ncbi:MAG: cation:proton antiporter [Solirubrobacterales bacterium]